MENEQIKAAVAQLDTVRRLSEVRGEVSVILRGIQAIRASAMRDTLELDTDLLQVYQQVMDIEDSVFLLHRRLERMAQVMADKTLQAALDAQTGE